jgi:hypothetical protein
MSKNELLINPNTNTHSFGKIPEIKYRNDYFQCGEIYLKQGEHRGINRGFGAEHIWEAHKKQLITLGYNSIEDVSKFISNIIRLKAPIHCEFDNIRGKHRISVITSSIGVAYLEERHDGNNDVFYSVVTAFLTKKTHGILIGNVCF